MRKLVVTFFLIIGFTCAYAQTDTSIQVVRYKSDNLFNRLLRPNRDDSTLTALKRKRLNRLSKSELADLENQLFSELDPSIWGDTLESDKEKKVKKVKIKRKVFYGYRTRKAFTRTRRGTTETTELFYILKPRKSIDPYVEEKFWYNVKTRQIRTGPIPEKEKMYAKPLHGPYARFVKSYDRQTGRYRRDLVTRGIYYIGSKHGRWEFYDGSENQILIDKQKYYRGYPKESEISYYDPKKEKIKEIIPIMYGEKHGMYYFFNEAGKLLETGRYEKGKKIGKWLEYHDDKKGKLKKRTIYPKSVARYNDFEPYIDVEYDATGKTIYSHTATLREGGELKDLDEDEEPTEELDIEE